jgi:diguanylate cyclase (GGDEF)-like protein/PAS domain S-box-containing protein
MEAREISKVLDNLYDAVWFVDKDRRITYWNDSAEMLSGYARSEMMGQDCHATGIVHLDANGQSYCQSHCPLLGIDKLHEVRKTDVYLRHKEGHMVPVQATLFPFRDDQGDIVGASEVFCGISVCDEVRRHMEELERLALLDPLTRLPNRKHLEDELAAHLAELDRLGRPFGFIMMDLDGFDKLNDKYGHDAGDEILRMVARTLILNSRPFDMVGRWEEDTFAAIVVQVDHAGVKAAAQRFQMLIERSELPWGEAPINVDVSVGAALSRRGNTVDSLSSKVEKRLREAKVGECGRVVLGQED